MEKLSIKELAATYGTYDLLTAYIMRTANVSEEIASDMMLHIDTDLERWIFDMLEEEDIFEEVE